MENTLIQQGAEAKIFLHNNIIEKQRIPKPYRHPQLDNQIRTRRTRSEAKILTKAFEAKTNVPKLLKQSTINNQQSTKAFTLYLEYIKGDRLSQTLNSYEEKKQLSIMKKLGLQTAKLHSNNIIHSDLTTSNTILQEKTNKLFLIDFGLSYISTKIEDKAVDLHLIKQALLAKHHQNHEKLFQAFVKGYQHENSKEILKRLEIVEKRGRYKH